MPPASSEADAVLLEMTGVTKSFGRVRALVDADLRVGPGEVHGLVGGNGAGKTTLMNVLYGLYRADSGEIWVGGAPVQIRSPRDAIALGIGMVHQQLLQVSAYAVVENVVVGTPGSGGMRAATRRIAELSERFGLAVDPRARTDRLSVGARQRVEIVKVLYRGARLLVLDEPTTNLTPQEVDALFASLRVIVAEGTSVVFISHKVREVLAICDRISVMRDGRRMTTVARASTDATGLASLMVGEPAAEQSSDLAAALGVAVVGEAQRSAPAAPAAPAAPRPAGQPVGAPRLAVRGLVVDGDQGVAALHGIDLEAAAGEVLGIAGVAGNGQVELAEALTGVRPVRAGSVRVDGADLAGGHTSRWLAAGVAYVPEDRHRDGILGAASVTDNLLLGDQRSRAWRRAGLLDWRRVRDHSRRTIERFAIRTPGPEAPAGNLSGGNIQRLILARAFDRSPTVLVLQNPTRGLDLRSTRFVYDQVQAARERGCAVVLISEDLDELSLLADRIAVLYSGELVGERRRGDYDAYALGRLMAGLKESA